MIDLLQTLLDDLTHTRISIAELLEKLKFFEENIMDKKMRKVTKKIRSAESTLKKAEKENVKLANFDEKVRDPMIKKYKKMKKK